MSGKLEKQISDHFQTLKSVSQTTLGHVSSTSQSAFNTVSNAPGALAAGAKLGFDAAANSAIISWHTSGTKSVTEKMTEDLRDYALHTQGWGGLCSKCERFPNAKNVNAEKSEEISFVTPLERVLYHADWCRLCGYLLRNLCRPENDPFQHPQIAEYLQPHLEGKSFMQWVESDSRYTDAQWPFGYGKNLHEGAFHYLDPVALKHKAKVRATLATAHLIPMMVKVAMTGSRSTDNPQLQAANKKTQQDIIRRDLKRTGQASKKQYAKETAQLNLIYPLECVLNLTIRTNQDPSRSGQVQASLLGYGRGFGAKLAVLSQFALKLQTEASYGNGDSPLSYGNLLNTRQIDLSLGAMWLHECEANHGARCSEQSWSDAVQAPLSLRVIDVKDNCIVKPSRINEFRYVALSYVWGKPAMETLMLSRHNVDQLSRKNGLTEYWHGVSTTIKDAIEVVRRMGERYLWVDALCIVQDQDVLDPEKHNQIAAMDWLYSKALFTIVASDSKHSMFGIAGVRADTRSLKQDSVQINTSTRLLTPIQVPHDLDNTLWDTRAWTFQERLLSRRLLVFQGGHMIWHCRSSIMHEDMLPSDKNTPYAPLSWLTLRKQFLGSAGKIDGSIMIFPDQSTHIVRSETFRQYTLLIEQYTYREMTKDSDILNALGGLLHIFRQFFKFPMRYGLPEILFDVALLWQPTEVLEVREAEGELLPSWSWAGWKGRVKYEEPFDAQADELLGTLTRFALSSDEYRREERIRPLVRWYTLSKKSEELVPLNKSGLGIPLLAIKSGLPEEWDKHPFGALVEPSPLKIEDLSDGMRTGLKPHHLIFRTTVLGSLVLGPPTPQDSDASHDPEYPPQRHSILSKGGKSLGTVLLDGDEPQYLEVKHAFVVLSEAQYYGLDFETRPGEGYELYNVMLVEWNAARTAAERLGLGRVDKRKWWAERPEVGIVCLE
jgi:hypothetical protein